MASTRVTWVRMPASEAESEIWSKIFGLRKSGPQCSMSTESIVRGGPRLFSSNLDKCGSKILTESECASVSFEHSVPKLRHFAITSSLEALFMIYPKNKKVYLATSKHVVFHMQIAALPHTVLQSPFTG